MKVVILCGGQGTRLREETEYRPKPMAKVGEHPILWHIMRHYAHHGFTEFVLCLGYKGEVIKDYFYNFRLHNSDFTVELGREQRLEFHSQTAEEGWRVTLADTGPDSLTGARVKRIASYLDDDEPFMLTYGDGVSDVDLRALLRFHREHGRIGTVTAVPPLGRFGELRLATHDVVGFSEKPLVLDRYINGGYFVFEPRMLDYLDSAPSCHLEREPLERLVAAGELKAYLHTGYWQCMDTYRDLKLLNETWAGGAAPWAVWDRPTSPAREGVG